MLLDLRRNAQKTVFYLLVIDFIYENNGHIQESYLAIFVTFLSKSIGILV